MPYKEAMDKAWNKISDLTADREFQVRFLQDTYKVDLPKREILSSASSAPPKEYIQILVLHYLIRKFKLKALPALTGKWISFKELEGGDGYYPAFKKRAIDIVLKRYISRPEGLLDLTESFKAKSVQIGDFSIILEIFENVPILITMWKGDEEFGPSANILFDANISRIFCTEDIVVMTEITIHSL